LNGKNNCSFYYFSRIRTSCLRQVSNDQVKLSYFRILRFIITGIKMGTSDKSKDELLAELSQLQKLYTSLQNRFNEEILHSKLVEKKSFKSEENFRNAVMNSSSSININRLSDGLYVLINHAFTKTLGYTEEDIAGKTSSELNIWDDPSKSTELINQLNKSGTILNFEVDFRRKDGTILNGLMSSFIIEIDGVPHIYNEIKDFTQRRLVDKALAFEQFLVNALMNNLPDHIYFKDLESKFVRINKSHALSFGLSDPREAIGKSDFDFFTEQAAHQAYEDEQVIIQTGMPIVKEEKLTRKDNSIAWFSATKMPLFDNNGNIIGTFGISRDISKERKAEEQIFLLANALKSINECVSITDMNDKVLFLNQTFFDTYGYEEHELREEPISFIRSPNNPPEIIKEILPSTLRGGWHGEILNQKKDGTEFLVSLSTSMVKDSNGQPVAMIGVANDITERKKTEEALRHSEERFRSVAQSANDPIISFDAKGNILGWNRGAEEVFGYVESEIIGKALSHIIPEDLVHLVIERTKHSKGWHENDLAGNTIEVNGLKKSGIAFPLELSLAEWQTSEGKFFTGIMRDITIRKRTELENKMNFEITQGITTTDNLDELFKLIHQSISKVLYAENIFIALYDPKTELFSFPYFVDKIDEEPAPTAMKKSCTAYVFRNLKPFLFTQELFDQLVVQDEVELIGTFSPSWIGIPLQTPSKVIGVLVLQHYEKENVYSESDLKLLISIGSQIAIAIERKKAEDEIRLKNEELQVTNAEKDKFFSILAHDLRGPLSAFVEATQILTEEIQSMSIEDIKDITGSMKTSATNLYSLLENLLEWSRLRRGGMDFLPKKFNLKDKVESCLEVFSESSKKKQINLDISINHQIYIHADEHMFESVIRNLVSNALKFTNVGGKVSISAVNKSNNSVEIKVIDTGIGMLPELQNKLFLINEKTSRQGTEGELSTGLGLLLCKEFIEKHGGKIRVESEEGKGSTFGFMLPCRSGDHG
jgi:PAS domain S-box-containing protein